MANYPKELAQDAAYQSHAGRLNGLWFMPKLALGLNTNYYYYYYYYHHHYYLNIKIFCRCSLFSSWSGQGLISTSVTISAPL